MAMQHESSLLRALDAWLSLVRLSETSVAVEAQIQFAAYQSVAADAAVDAARARYAQLPVAGRPCFPPGPEAHIEYEHDFDLVKDFAVRGRVQCAFYGHSGNASAAPRGAAVHGWVDDKSNVVHCPVPRDTALAALNGVNA